MPSIATKRIRIGTLTVFVGRDRDLVLRQVFQEYPDKVVLNGSDCTIDPMMWISQHIRRWKLKPIAFFHTGPSADFWSGVVIERTDLHEVKVRFKREYNIPLEEVIEIWKRE